MCPGEGTPSRTSADQVSAEGTGIVSIIASSAWTYPAPREHIGEPGGQLIDTQSADNRPHLVLPPTAAKLPAPGEARRRRVGDRIPAFTGTDGPITRIPFVVGQPRSRHAIFCCRFQSSAGG